MHLRFTLALLTFLSCGVLQSTEFDKSSPSAPSQAEMVRGDDILDAEEIADTIAVPVNSNVTDQAPLSRANTPRSCCQILLCGGHLGCQPLCSMQGYYKSQDPSLARVDCEGELLCALCQEDISGLKCINYPKARCIPAMVKACSNCWQEVCQCLGCCCLCCCAAGTGIIDCPIRILTCGGSCSNDCEGPCQCNTRKCRE